MDAFLILNLVRRLSIIVRVLDLTWLLCLVRVVEIRIWLLNLIMSWNHRLTFAKILVNWRDAWRVWEKRWLRTRVLLLLLINLILHLLLVLNHLVRILILLLKTNRLILLTITLSIKFFRIVLQKHVVFVNSHFNVF